MSENVKYNILSDTTVNIDTVKRAKLLAEDTVKDHLVYYKQDGTTLMHAICADSSNNITNDIGNMDVADGKYIGLGAAKGRLQFDDEVTDTITVKDASLIAEGNITADNYSFETDAAAIREILAGTTNGATFGATAAQKVGFHGLACIQGTSVGALACNVIAASVSALTFSDTVTSVQAIALRDYCAQVVTDLTAAIAGLNSHDTSLTNKGVVA